MIDQERESRRAFRAKDLSRQRAEVLRLLDVEGCPICACASREEENWLDWYRAETNSESSMVLHLRHSHGFCPRHTRSFGLDGAMGGFLTSMYADVTRYGLTAPATEPCPACNAIAVATLRDIRRLVSMLDDREVEAAYEASGCCVGHCCLAIGEASPRLVGRLVAQLAKDLNESPTLDRVAGADLDAHERSRLFGIGRAVLEGELHQFVNMPAIDRIETALGIAACPICRAFQRGVVAYFHFLTDEVEAGTKRAEWAALCRNHLHEITALDERVATWAREVVARQSTLALTQYAEIAQWNARSRLSRMREVWRSSPLRWRAPSKTLAGAKRRAQSQTVMELLDGAWRCEACAAGEALASRELALFRALVGEPRFERALANSHGFCLRHASSFSAASSVVVRRMQTLQWELDEAVRKRAWATRYEPKGIEFAAWREAASLYDGANLVGLTAEEVAKGTPQSLDGQIHGASETGSEDEPQS